MQNSLFFVPGFHCWVAQSFYLLFCVHFLKTSLFGIEIHTDLSAVSSCLIGQPPVSSCLIGCDCSQICSLVSASWYAALTSNVMLLLLSTVLTLRCQCMVCSTSVDLLYQHLTAVYLVYISLLFSGLIFLVYLLPSLSFLLLSSTLFFG